MPFYIDDFEAATAHLSFAEDGAYNRLIRLCWRTNNCSVPNDPKWIIRRLRATQEEFDTIIKPIIAEFFTVNRGRIYQKRLRSEFDKAERTFEARSSAGKKGVEAKALKSKENTSSQANGLLKANGKQSLSNQNQNHIDKKSNKKRNSKLSNDWELPDEYRQWVKDQNICHDDSFIDRVANNFHDHWLGNGETKKDWLATWRKWCRSDWTKWPNNADENHSTFKSKKQEDAENLERYLEYYKKNNHWVCSWGFGPDDFRCTIPQDILDKHGIPDPRKKLH